MLRRGADRRELIEQLPAVLSPATAPDRRAEAELIFALAEPLESFIAGLFGIDAELAALQARERALDPLVPAKWKFVKRQAVLTVTP